MESIKLKDFDQKLPDLMPVSVVMEKRPSTHEWSNFNYQVVGILTADEVESESVKKIHAENGVEQFLFTGLKLRLHVDECESYYHNMMSPQPGCFVVASEVDDLDDMPVPYLVSLSFDEAHAYLEGCENVYAVEIPPLLYQWMEAFVLAHYAATKKTKRKRKDWKDQAQPNISVEPKP